MAIYCEGENNSLHWQVAAVAGGGGGGGIKDTWLTPASQQHMNAHP
jgi:hypothetical protein